MADTMTNHPFYAAPDLQYPEFGSFQRTVFDHDIVPKNFDVVCGRDALAQRHVGNKRFHFIIMMNHLRYKASPSRDAKTRISREIVGLVRACHGRFLKLDAETCLWEDVGDEYARDKVSHALRSAKDPNQKKAPRKRKAPSSKPKIDYENAVFAELLDSQQQIFKQLLFDEGHNVDHFPCLNRVTPMSIDEAEAASTVVSL